MKTLLTSWLDAELVAFRQLPETLRAMTRSVGLYYFAFPVVMVFVTTFVLRQSGVIAILLYHLGFYLAIPAVFIVNSYLWRIVSLRKLYFAGAVGQGLVLLILLFTTSLSLPLTFLFGLLMALPVGLFFANRNYLDLALTNDHNRNYYGGLKTAIGTIAGVVMPMVIGIFIKLGNVLPWYTVEGAYQIVAIMTLMILLISGWLLKKVNVKTPQVTSYIRLQRPAHWGWAILSTEGWGFFNAIDFIIPPLIVFQLLGSEGTLGALISLGSLCSAIMLYYLGKWLKPSMRMRLVTTVVSIMALVTLGLSWWYVPAMAVLFMIVLIVAMKTGWGFRDPIMMKHIDTLAHHRAGDKNVYLLDMEASLGLGRLLALGTLFWVLQGWGEQLMVRVGISVGAIMLIVMLVGLVRFEREMN